MESAGFIDLLKNTLENSFDFSFSDRLPAMIFSLVCAAATIALGFWLGGLASKLIIKILKKRNVDRSVHYFLGRTVSAIIKIIFVVTALAKLGFNVNSFVAALGAAGVTAGLGLKDSISQFASGIQILFNQPFHSGDLIEIEGMKGKVRDIHFMYTTLIMEDNRYVTIPNNHITSGNIINYTAADLRRVDLVYSISYSQDIAKAKEVLYMAARENKYVAENPPVFVAVKEHAGSSVNLACQVWCRSGDYLTAFYSMQEAVKIAFDKNGIEIPFEQLDVHIKNDKEQL